MFPKETRILVVDDASIARQLICGLLNEIGFTNIKQASDGDVALEMIATENQNKTPFQLIFADIVMARINGIELLRRIRGANDSVPILMLTAENDRSTVMEVLKLGASNFIVKPVNKAGLEDKIMAVYGFLNKAAA